MSLKTAASPSVGPAREIYGRIYRMKITALFFAAVSAAVCACGAETHADAITALVLDNVAKIRMERPDAVPMAFWDFDGTIIKGDISEGFEFLPDRPEKPYKGLVERTIEEGLNSVYKREGGWERFAKRDYPMLGEIGRWISWPYNAQMYHGQSAAEIEAFAEAECERVYRKWYFASSIKIWRALAQAGVENYVVSGSPEIFVRGVAKSLGIPRERCRGARVDIVAGRVTTKVQYPVPTGEGKVEIVRELVLGRPGGVAVAAFGNSYSTDADFMRYVATQQSLPGGARGTAVMVNGGPARPGYTEYFVCVAQDETLGE